MGSRDLQMGYPDHGIYDVTVDMGPWNPPFTYILPQLGTYGYPGYVECPLERYLEYPYLRIMPLKWVIWGIVHIRDTVYLPLYNPRARVVSDTNIRHPENSGLRDFIEELCQSGPGQILRSPHIPDPRYDHIVVFGVFGCFGTSWEYPFTRIALKQPLR